MLFRPQHSTKFNCFPTFLHFLSYLHPGIHQKYFWITDNQFDYWIKLESLFEPFKIQTRELKFQIVLNGWNKDITVLIKKKKICLIIYAVKTWSFWHHRLSIYVSIKYPLCHSDM